MPALADTMRGDDSALFAMRVISDATQREATRDWQGRPYAIWRAEERAFLWLKSVQAMMTFDAYAHHARTWNWTSYLNGGRLTLRPSGFTSLPGERHVTARWAHVRMADGSESAYGIQNFTVPANGRDVPRTVFRDVGPHDVMAGAHRPTVRATRRDGGARVTFPDWATVAPCAPKRRAVTAVPYVNPMASVYAARIAHGMHGSPFSDIPPVHPSTCACQVCVPVKRIPRNPWYSR